MPVRSIAMQISLIWGHIMTIVQLSGRYTLNFLSFVKTPILHAFYLPL